MANKYSKLIATIKSIKTYEDVCKNFENPDYLWAGYISINTHEDGITLYNTMSKDSWGWDNAICTFYYKGVAHEDTMPVDSEDYYEFDLVALDFEGTDLLKQSFEEAGIKIC